MAAPTSQIPGDPTPISLSLTNTASSAIQSFAPISNIHNHLCAFHFYADDMTRQIESHHYCAHLNEDVRQCLIFDSPEPAARLIGVEYIVSEPIYLTLPDEEKPLWHSHLFEVQSGVLFLPGVPGAVQRRDLEKVAKTYGKTFHFWQVDRGDELPLGIPNLMMALTGDGQLHESLSQGFHKLRTRATSRLSRFQHLGLLPLRRSPSIRDLALRRSSVLKQGSPSPPIFSADQLRTGISLSADLLYFKQESPSPPIFSTSNRYGVVDAPN